MSRPYKTLVTAESTGLIQNLDPEETKQTSYFSFLTRWTSNPSYSSTISREFHVWGGPRVQVWNGIVLLDLQIENYVGSVSQLAHCVARR